MSGDLARIESLLEVTVKGLDDLKRMLAPKRKPLSRSEFAELVGLSYKTICRKVDAGELPLVDGKIPYKYADRYLS